MNHKERFAATMHYQPCDRAPLYDFNFWDETLPEWHKQGLPVAVNHHNAEQYFGLDFSIGGGEAHEKALASLSMDICPPFEEIVIEDLGENEIVQQADGARVLRQKNLLGSIPAHVGHLLTDRASWEKHYKPRLDASIDGRYPADWDQKVAEWADPARDYPVFVWGRSLYGSLRNWMGVENLSMLVYDDPTLFEEMVETQADLSISFLERALATGARFEACGMWEDMCFNAGPLLGPEHFKRYLVPHYKRITSLLHKHGVDDVYVDSDGCIDKLLPLWLESGVNCMFPIEVGTWGADPVRFRKEYGKDLLMMGGVNKSILARSKDEIEREIKRLAPLVEEGGYIPMPDHRVPPNVPFENYVHYCQTIRQIWGRNVNLPERKPFSGLTG